MPLNNTEKALHNVACTLLSGMSWAVDRLRDGDHRGDADHPLHEGTANVESSLQIILHARIQPDDNTPRIVELMEVVRQIATDLEPPPANYVIIQDWIQSLRDIALFKELGIPMDQEVPPYQPWHEV